MLAGLSVSEESRSVPTQVSTPQTSGLNTPPHQCLRNCAVVKDISAWWDVRFRGEPELQVPKGTEAKLARPPDG